MALATTMSSCPKTSSRIGDSSLLLLNNRHRRADRLQTREDDATAVVVAVAAASAAGLAGQFAAAAQLAGLADESAAATGADADDVRAFALTVAGRTLPQTRKRRRADRKQVTAAIRAAMKSTMTMDLKSEGPKGGAATSLSGSAVASSSSSSTGASSGMGSGTAVTPGHGHGQHGHVAVGEGAGSGGSSAGGVVTSAAGGGGLQRDCAGCKKRISERYMLKALDLFWHEDCLKCACCDCRLGEVGSTLFTKANLMLCKRDYLRLFGTTGYCSACSKMIPAFEMVMRARGNVYHLECFACQQCNHRFCVGDRFYLCENKILCEYDYEERMVFANMPYNYNSIAHIKRQTHNLNPAVLNDNDGSSGYGSPDSLTFDGK